jgi:hypothetical protein
LSSKLITLKAQIRFKLKASESGREYPRNRAADGHRSWGVEHGGQYPENALNFAVQARLRALAEKVQAFSSNNKAEKEYHEYES